MPIESDLEANRVQELDELLTIIHPKIVNYVAQADPNLEHYKSDSLGTYHEPQTLKKVFTSNDAIFEKGLKHSQKELFEQIDNVLSYSVNTWNPGFLDKLYASTNPIGVISDIILSVLNTNSHVYTVSPVLSVLENYMGKKYAGLFWEDNAKAGGLTFSGGSWSNITAMHMARSLNFPETKLEGNAGHRFAVFSSKHCHYSVEKAAILLGLGQKSVFKVDINHDGTMKPEALESAINKAVADGYTPLFINATAGTTVFGSFDDLEKIGPIARKHKIWLHVDGSWGGNVVFSKQHRSKLQGVQHADSVTVNPHKMLGTPTTCSFLLVQDVGHFQTANSLSAPYLFHGRDNDEENHDLADGTMGCGRRADLFKFYLSWLYYGEEGLRKRVDHAFDIVEYFRSKISAIDGFELVVPEPQCLQVCFYYRPPGYTKTSFSDVTRFVSRELHKRGKYLVDFSPDTANDAKGEFFRVVFNSPILTDKVVDDLVESIVAIAAEYKE